MALPVILQMRMMTVTGTMLYPCTAWMPLLQSRTYMQLENIIPYSTLWGLCNAPPQLDVGVLCIVVCWQSNKLARGCGKHGRNGTNLRHGCVASLTGSSLHVSRSLSPRSSWLMAAMLIKCDCHAIQAHLLWQLISVS